MYHQVYRYEHSKRTNNVAKNITREKQMHRHHLSSSIAGKNTEKKQLSLAGNLN